MEATRFERPPAALFAAVSLAAMIAAFAIGQARAQTVNPVPPPPPPVFNPSSPSTVPQAPEAPVSPTPPTGLSSPAPALAPASPAIEPPPAVTPQTATAPAPASPAVVPPPAVTPQTAIAPEAATPALSPTHAGHHGAVRHRWSRRHVRFHAARVLGPSYYPGLGEFYPPYANPCHFSRVWSGYYAGLWSSYGCSW
jgi:hypothetical protein